jgi:uncharacterized protein
MRYVVSALAMALALAGCASVSQTPMPPAPTQYVTDTTGSLDDATVSALNTELANFKKRTGDNVLVWVGQTTGGQALEDWTIDATEAWKIDMKGKSNSAILFVFMQDHKVRIEVGYSLEPALTDAISSEIIRDTMTPKLKAGDVNGAITAGTEQVLVTIAPSYASQIKDQAASADDSVTGSNGNGSSPGPFPFFIGFFLLAIVISSVARASRRGTNGYWLAGGLPFFAGMGGGGIGSGFGGPTFGGGGGGFSGGGFGGGFGGGGASGGW